MIDSDASAPPSPRCDSGWTLVERSSSEGAPEPLVFSTARPRSASSSSEPFAEAAGEQEELHDGMKSPASERLADDVLREPFQAGARLLEIAAAAPPAGAAVEEPGTPTGASGPYTTSCGDLTAGGHGPRHATDLALAAAVAQLASSVYGAVDTSSGGCTWGSERHREQREVLRAVSRLSGEGALEGFQDPQVTATAATEKDAGTGDDDDDDQDDSSWPAPPPPPPLAPGGSPPGSPPSPPGWSDQLRGMWAYLLRGLGEMRQLLATTALEVWGRMAEGREAVEGWTAHMRVAAHQAAKSVATNGCPLWVLMGVSGVGLVAVAALAIQVASNRQLAQQLRKRDKDLARLVVKILNLQDALQTAARAALPQHPHHLQQLMRHTVTTTLIGMV